MPPESPYTLFRARRDALQSRVNDAAQSLHTRGLRPTVARVRAALGGGSPNDLTPALKHWRDTILPSLPTNPETNLTSTLPPPITDLARELWRRAIAAATTEIKGNATARRLTAQTEEIQVLRTQLTSLRDQLEKETLAHGASRAQTTRYEVIAREALARAQASDARERTLLREVGSLRQKIAELEAAVKYRRAPPHRPARAIGRGAPKLRQQKAAPPSKRRHRS